MMLSLSFGSERGVSSKNTISQLGKCSATIDKVLNAFLIASLTPKISSMTSDNFKKCSSRGITHVGRYLN
jgi:hypothetical protein